MFSRMRTTAWSLAAFLVVSGAVGYSLAQPSGDSTVDVIKLDPVGESSAERPLSAAEQLDVADAAVEAATANCSGQAEALQSAKRSKDIIRATCLDDKLTQCVANLQNMKRRQAALKEALAEGDRGRANHESTVIEVLSQKFKMLAQAANQCVGQDLFDTGDTVVQAEVDPFAPQEPANSIPQFTDWPIPFFPPPVSGIN